MPCMPEALKQGSGCRVQGAGCRVQGAGCRVRAAGCRVQGAGCRVQGAGFGRTKWMQGAGCRVQGAGCRVQGATFRVQGSGCRVRGYKVDGLVPPRSRCVACHPSPCVREGRCKATWLSEFKLSWREAGPPNRPEKRVASGQEQSRMAVHRKSKSYSLLQK